MTSTKGHCARLSDPTLHCATDAGPQRARPCAPP
jgi:hypothetical protein